MTFTFNPHRHVKIWLSKDKDSFLNLENQLRLIRMRETNKKDEIYFIYESRLLSKKAREELEQFCTEYHLIAKDMPNDIIPHCQTQQELLIKCVLYTSGPAAVAHASFDEFFYNHQTIDEKVAPRSLNYYGLNKVFLSYSAITLHQTKSATPNRTDQPLFKNDPSWIKYGQDKIKAREDKIRQNTTLLQGFFRGHLHRKASQISEKQPEVGLIDPPTQKDLCSRPFNISQ